MSRRAMAERRSKVNKIGKITGKLKIAISVALLFARAAMEEIKVNAIEKPVLPRNRVSANNG